MSGDGATALRGRPPRAGHSKRARGRRRWPWVVLALLLLALAAAGWVADRTLRIKADLDLARAEAATLQQAILGGDTTRAHQALTTLQQRAAQARARSDDPMVRAATRLPVAGDDLAAVRAVARAADDLGQGVLPDIVATGVTVRPEALRPEPNRLALQPLREARPVLATAASTAGAVNDDLAALDTSGLTAPVNEAVTAAQRSVADLADALADGATAARLLPPMFGGAGTRRYFVALQNNAESRGTGGLLGAYGILEADRGTVRMARLGPNTELRSLDELPLDLGPEFTRLYGDDPGLWANANMSPHFPYAARLWLEMWRRQTGQRLDGVIATDPVGLSHVLRATGPATLPSGEQVTADNAVRLTMSEVYARFPDPTDPDRDRFLQRVSAAAFDRLLSAGGNPRALAAALGNAVADQRLRVYSAHEDEQRVLATTPLGGVLDDRPGPYAAVVVNNVTGSKLDYYLDRSLRYTAAACTGRERRSRIDVDLTNTAPASGLPPYVTLRVDAAAQSAPPPPRPGSTVLLVQIYAAMGARLDGARLDGKPAFVAALTERGRPVFRLPVSFEPGQTRRLRLDLVEPAAPGPARVPEQPLVRPQHSTVEVSPCSR